MITLLTGVPGNGKTLYAVQMVKKAIESGRTVFCDIEGLKIEGVLPCPADWRQSAPGSLLVYDEAHRLFPATGRSGPAGNPIIDDMDTHRHTGHDIVLITQRPNKIHHVIRGLVGTHKHFMRKFGLQASNVYTWERVVDDCDSKSKHKEGDIETFKFPKDLYGLYKSSVDHTQHNKVWIPSRYRWIALALVLGVLFVAYRIHGWKSTSPAQAAETVPAVTVADLRPKVQGTAGCISYGSVCYCFGFDGSIQDQGYGVCVGNAADPMLGPKNARYAPEDGIPASPLPGAQLAASQPVTLLKQPSATLKPLNAKTLEPSS